MKIIITRHGQTTWNFENKHKFQGITDIELSEIGKKQSEKLANRLKDIIIDSIYCSPLKRCIQTRNEILKKNTPQNLIIEENLKEINFGIFESLTKEEVKTKYSEIWTQREKNKLTYQIPKGESLNQVQTRANKVLTKILKEKKDVLIIAHATLNMFFFTKLMNKSFQEINKRYYNNCEISIFEIDEKENVKVELFNCGKHLE